jgi:hypothetical protein
MSQQIFSEIIPTVTSGTQLATILNNFKDAVVSGFSGTSRPVNLQAGGYWIDTTNDATGFWDFKLYTGAADIVLMAINKNSLSASILSTDSQFEIVKTSDDDIGPVLKFLKERIAGGGQTLTNDELAVVEFTGTRDDSVEAIQAVIKVVSTDDVTSTTQGAAFILEMANTGSSSLSQKLIVVDGKVGIGLSNPAQRLHIDGNLKVERSLADDASAKIITRKRRVAANGGILTLDKVGEIQTFSTDSDGTEVLVASSRVDAIQNHTPTELGVEVRHYSVVQGETVPTEYMRINTGIVLFRNVTAEEITATALNNAAVVTPSRLDVKQDTESNLSTYALTATNGQIVFATDSKAYFGVLDTEIVPLGGGAGGSSLVWDKDFNGPVSSSVEGVKIELFDDESDQAIYAMVSVPSSYRAGKPISLLGGLVATEETSGNIFFKTFSSIFKSGVVLGSGPSQHTSTNTELTATATPNELISVGVLDLTDSSGEIDGVPVAPGDRLLVELVRVTGDETLSAAGQAKLLINSFELSFS